MPLKDPVEDSPEDEAIDSIEPVETLFNEPFDSEWTLVVHTGKNPEKGIKTTLPPVPGLTTLEEFKERILQHISQDSAFGAPAQFLPDNTYLALSDNTPIEIRYGGLAIKLPFPVSINPSFVTGDGSTRGMLPMSMNSGVMLADLIPNGPIDEIHVYPLSAIIDAARRYQTSGARGATSARMFHGYLRVYFPKLTRNPLETPLPLDTAKATELIEIVTDRLEHEENLEAQLQELAAAKPSKRPTMARVRGYRRFGMRIVDAFTEALENGLTLQSLFHKLPTSASLPFLRFIAGGKNTTAITKLYTIPGLRVQIPYIRDHRVVRAWLGERRLIDPDTSRPLSYITFKIEVVTTPKIVYATGTIYDNGMMALSCETDIVIPPETILKVRDILVGFAIDHGVRAEIAENINITDIGLELRWAPERDRPLLITESAIRSQLPNFEPFFAESEETPPAPTAIAQTMKRLGDLTWTRISRRPAYSGATSSALTINTVVNEAENDELEVIETIKSIGASFEQSPQLSMFASSSEVAIVVSGLSSHSHVGLLQTLITMLLASAESGKIAPAAAQAAPGSEVPLKKYYITQLKEADEALFEYREKGSGQNQYSRKCGARVKRQPNVLTPEQFRRHVEEYDEDVAFWVYDSETYVPGTVPPSTIDGKEVIHFIKTTTKVAPPGSSAKAREALMRYYFCPLYWCVYDNMMILKRDYESTTWRNPDKKGPKPRNTCPFCGGKEVPSKATGKDKKAEPMIVLQGTDRRTVIMRTDAGSPPRYPHIISEHPDDPNYRLPCCNVRLNDIEAKLRTHAAKPFSKLFKKFSEVNILSADKNDPKPLAPGKLGALRPALKDFFHRGIPETTLFINQGAHRMIAPKRHAVLQVGLDNSPLARSYSFLSLLAFYAGVKEPLPIDDLVDRMMQFATPRIFQQLQYGRLVHEFYNETAEVPADTVLDEWCETYGLDTPNSENRVYLQRLYVAYANFETYTRVGVTMDPDSPEGAVKFKDWRVYAHLARLPGFLHPRGVQLILLEMTHRGGQKYRVLCPPGGVSDLDPAVDAPVAVAIFTPKYFTWEPLVLCDTNGTQMLRLWDMDVFSEKYKAVHESMQGMIVEYRAAGRCGPPVTATLGEGQMTTTELLAVLKKAKIVPQAAVRDVYNQLRGYVVDGGSGGVFLPCVDDGTVADFNAYYEKRGFAAANAATIAKFYETHAKVLGPERRPIEILVLSEDALAIEQVRRSTGSGFWIVGMRLANGEIVPASIEATTETALMAKPTAGKLPLKHIQFLPDTIDRILYGVDNPHWDISHVSDASETILRRRRLIYEEVYQHVRIALAGRLSSDTSLRLRIEEILGTEPHHYQRTVPQKQREMLVLIAAAMKDIVVPIAMRDEFRPHGENEPGYENSARLRRNCVEIKEDPDKCKSTSQCAWMDHAAVCRVRMPGQIDGITEDPDLHIAKRIADELVRYPARRDEIMNNKIPRMPAIRNPMFSEHGELLFPELAADFTEFATHYWKQPSIYRNHYRFYGDEGLMVESNAAEDSNAINELMEPENIAALEGEELIDEEGLFNMDD